MPYTVSTPVFEGPFDLLLHLITKEQVDLWEVSLSSIVDGYVATLAEMQAALDLEIATEFLMIAAVLLELKARRLLPDREDAEPEEELALWEERDLLIARLLECKTFKDAAAALARRMESAGRSWPRTAGLDEPFENLVPDVLAGVTGGQLRSVMERLLAPKPQAQVATDHIAPIRASVGDAVVELLAELPRVRRVTFRELSSGLVERLEVIVRFLALLELYKYGSVELEQPVTFGDLEVVWVAMPEEGVLAAIGAGANDSPAAGIEEYEG